MLNREFVTALILPTTSPNSPKPAAPRDTTGMSRHRFAPYIVHYLKDTIIVVVSGS